MFHKNLIQSAFGCQEGNFLVDKPFVWVYIECSFYVCDPPTLHGIIHLKLLSSVPSVFDFDFSRSAAEDATCLLGDMQDLVVKFIFYFYLLHFVYTFSQKKLHIERASFLWKTLGLSINVAEPFLNRALLLQQRIQEDVMRCDKRV